eukprot:482898-Pelagomonas_calceolata.AAC.5
MEENQEIKSLHRPGPFVRLIWLNRTGAKRITREKRVFNACGSMHLASLQYSCCAEGSTLGEQEPKCPPSPQSRQEIKEVNCSPKSRHGTLGMDYTHLRIYKGLQEGLHPGTLNYQAALNNNQYDGYGSDHYNSNSNTHFVTVIATIIVLAMAMGQRP